MIKKSLAVLALTSFVSLNAIESDSYKHYGYSAVFGFASETYFQIQHPSLSNFEKISYGTIVGTVPGLVKELTDDEFSRKDLAYDFAGALTGALISNYVNNNTSIFVSHNSERDSTQVKVAYNF